MSNQPGIRKPMLSVMGITGAVGQITCKEQCFEVANSPIKHHAHLEVVGPDSVEYARPAVPRVSQTVQEDHRGRLANTVISISPVLPGFTCFIRGFNTTGL